MSRDSKEQLVLQLLGDLELFGLDILKASNGRIGRTGFYGLIAGMEKKGLISSRPVKKTLTIKETMDGKVYERQHIYKQRLYQRGIPMARALKCDDVQNGSMKCDEGPGNR